MINDLKFRGCRDNDAQAEVQRVKTVEEGMDATPCFLVLLLNREKVKNFSAVDGNCKNRG